jgi:hypothetical protein
MSSRAIARASGAAFVIAIQLSLAACNNTYGPPPDGKPTNWGQQHYLDVQAYRLLNENRMNN